MIWFLGAGSGGHLAPNYAVYKKMKTCKNLKFRFVLTGGILEKKYSNERRLPSYHYFFDRLVTGNLVQKIFKIIACVCESLWYLCLDRPSLIVSTGGYGSFPGLFWAKLLKIPYVLIEPNKVAGKVNRWFSGEAQLIITNYENVPDMDSKKVSRLGVPLLLEAKNGRGRKLLAFGASQGAKSINRLMQKVVEDGFIRPIHWIVGARDYEEYRGYDNLDGVVVEAFCNDMQIAYDDARLVLCRSGAGTVAEIHAMNLPAVFVPFPNHQDRQQYRNCEYLKQAGCCLIWEDESLPNKLSELKELWSQKSKLEEMSSCYRKFSVNPIDACDKVVEELLKLLSRG